MSTQTDPHHIEQMPKGPSAEQLAQMQAARRRYADAIRDPRPEPGYFIEHEDELYEQYGHCLMLIHDGNVSQAFSDPQKAAAEIDRLKADGCTSFYFSAPSRVWSLASTGPTCAPRSTTASASIQRRILPDGLLAD